MSSLQLGTIIVDPNVNRRMRLKAATNSVIQFGKVSLFSSIQEAIRGIESSRILDVAFLSYELPKEELDRFISELKAKPSGQDAAFIMVLPAKDQNSSAVVKNVLSGADGLLFEPYSVDQLVEITQVASKVKLERSMARERVAYLYLLEDLSQHLDRVSYALSLKQNPGLGLKKLREAASIVQGISPESLSIFHSILIEKFADMPFPIRAFQKNYKGASKRVREKMEQKLMEEFDS